MKKDSVRMDILEAILNSVNYYSDQNNDLEFYVEFQGRDNIMYFELMSSERFLAYVGSVYRRQTNQKVLPPIGAMLKIRREDLITFGATPIEVCRRLTGSIREENILYFLADEKYNVVQVTPDTVEVGNQIFDTNRRFLKYPLDQEQVMPIVEDPPRSLFELLKPYVNLSEDDFLLFVITLVHYFSRDSSHFAMIFSSQKGSGKSTLSKLVRKLVEPSKSEITLTSNSENDLKTTLAGNYVVCFDNTDTMSASFSNILCGAITGAKDVKRKLYTDFDQVVLDLHNVVIVNGIEIVPYRSDLAERSLIFSLEKITGKGRKTDSEFWKTFEKDRPYILGEIFMTLQKAMQLYASMDITGPLHRMADANREMLAIAAALDISAEKCQSLIDGNAEKMKETYTQSNPFVDAVIDYFWQQDGRKLKMRASSLYKTVYDSITGVKKFFPGSPSAFTRKLWEEKEMLESAGIRLDKESNKYGTTILLEKIPEKQKTKAQKEEEARQENLRMLRKETREWLLCTEDENEDI